MCDLMLYRDSDKSDTSISNLFIDEYLADANDAQIKVYLYLIRMTNANLPTTISDIADKFNHTEKDVCRALRYWEKKGLISLDYDQNGGIVGIRLYDPSVPIRRVSQTNRITSSYTQVKCATSSAPLTALPDINAEETTMVKSFTKPQYSLDEIKEFKMRDDTPQLLFVAEKYLNKTLSANDIRSILFYLDELHFSVDLIDYLLQYCVEHEKTSFAYMDKVAIDWAENNIATVKQAKKYVGAKCGTVKKTAAAPKTPKKSTSFHQLEQNNYDFTSLEAQLLSRK